MNHPKMKHLYVGIDCHKITHTASIINCFNEPLGTVTFNNDNNSFLLLMELLDKVLVDYKDCTPIFGLEDIKHFGHLLSKYLIDNNYTVKYVNSSLTFSERKKNPIISKNDEADSLCIAKVLLDNLDTLPNGQNDEIFWTLKQLVTMKKSLTTSYQHYKNKLHSQLLHHYPNYQKMFSYIDSKTALIFFDKYPSPQGLENMHFEALYEELKPTYGRNNTVNKVKEILELVKEYDLSGNIYQEERNYLIKLLIKQLRDTDKKIIEIEQEIVNIYDKIGYKLHTLVGLSKVTAACMVAEIGNIKHFKNASQLARYAGIAPIEFSSGNSTKFVNNKYGNRRLNSMIYFQAVRNICPGKTKVTPPNAIFLEYFNKKVSEGKTKKQALVCVMRRLVNIIYGILKNNTEYVHPIELEQECKSSYLKRYEEKQAKEKEKLETVKQK